MTAAVNVAQPHQALQAMPKSANLARIGSKIRIDLARVKNRIPQNLINKLNTDPRATVLDYKMTDGGGVGVVVRFNDGTKRWFFEDEFGGG